MYNDEFILRTFQFFVNIHFESALIFLVSAWIPLHSIIKNPLYITRESSMQ
ncbi:hypothetical protein HMPREF0083_01311 [Aneurinibacillus aneurinilyticus ATCC 12856]|uniref:Uncharacterized protein n=1 Tax=Aneurinibacillus aneurinilyticus ATCC 12856 TaxID=649747 RepID=U1X7U1_ANEAE|nr:hypothetical protein HMPREF0083_01311 [Aneurinibacillus aneurinilyticus ATCC 12856]